MCDYLEKLTHSRCTRYNGMLLCDSNSGGGGGGSDRHRGREKANSVGIDLMHARWDTICGMFNRVAFDPRRLHVGNQGCTQKRYQFWEELAGRVKTMLDSKDSAAGAKSCFKFAVVRNPYDRVRR